MSSFAAVRIRKPQIRASTDGEDVRGSCQGDPDAFRRLIERHQAHVSQILWRFSRNQGVHEELVQDTFVEAYVSLQSYQGSAPLSHWLARIATRVGYRHWKKSVRDREREHWSLEQWDQLPGSADGLDRVEPNEAGAILHDLLGQMSPRDRLVLTLRYLEGLDVAETAERTGWSRTMVKVQTLRARNKLRSLLEQSQMELI